MHHLFPHFDIRQLLIASASTPRSRPALTPTRSSPSALREQCLIQPLYSSPQPLPVCFLCMGAFAREAIAVLASPYLAKIACLTVRIIETCAPFLHSTCPFLGCRYCEFDKFSEIPCKSGISVSSIQSLLPGYKSNINSMSWQGQGRTARCEYRYKRST
jgi:hypothetical protein